jgi:hypothetical protein
MKPYRSKLNLTVPLYDLGTLAAGFYIGYNEGKGVDVSPTVEYLTKYGPTAIAVCMTPITLKAINIFGKWTNRKIIQNLQDGNLEITLKDRKKRGYKDLSEHQKQEVTPKIIERINTLESRLQNQKYLRPTMVVGTRTAIETFIGYAAGRLYSQIS